ncbi:MAG: hypothetical protein GEU90_11310 [Gemmatimonas sp.]|nr:hypothetical protein [Gemmatimonas sp.]
MTRSRIEERQRRRDAGRALTYVVGGILFVAGCDSILEVEVPGQITEEGAFSPEQAEVLVNGAIADIECGLSDFIASNAAGSEDVTSRSVGWWGTVYEFGDDPGTANCSIAETSYGWFVPLHKGRMTAERVYDKLANEWTDEQVADREEKLAMAAIYAGITYTLFGEYFCEMAADTGPLMSWEESLQTADQWFTLALGHIASAGDFVIPTDVTTSARLMAHLLRARARFAMDDFAGAEADAMEIPQGFIAYITRESGGERTRWNRVNSAHVGQPGWAPTLGPIEWWSGPADPVNGKEWPAIIPFTGYWDLGVLPDGRAIRDDQYPVTTTGSETAIADPRVPVLDLGEVSDANQYPIWRPEKYPSLETDIPLAKWEEAWLIRAQIAYLRDGDGATAISLVNEIRTVNDIPAVTYLSAADATGVENMLIEEIRRTHFLEGRYWSAKLRYDLWFPRGEGADLFSHPYNRGVRLVMPEDEFDQNPNLSQEDRGSMCPAGENPIT